MMSKEIIIIALDILYCLIFWFVIVLFIASSLENRHPQISLVHTITEMRQGLLIVASYALNSLVFLVIATLVAAFLAASVVAVAALGVAYIMFYVSMLTIITLAYIIDHKSAKTESFASAQLSVSRCECGYPDSH